MTLQERIYGAIYGMLIGDALGVPYEFHSASAIPPLQDIEFIPPKGFVRSHRSVPPGTWSDDGAQALCLLASLLHCQGFDARDFANRIANWYAVGYMTPDGKVFDIGMQTIRAIQAIQLGEEPMYIGLRNMEAKGNGSLMRVLPLALWHNGSDEELVEAAQDQSCVTHGAYACQVCCALYCVWARRIMQAHASPLSDAIATLRRIYANDYAYLDELENEVQPHTTRTATGTGFVIDSFHSARWALEQNSYEAVVKHAISLGKDTDTTACIAGGLAGLKYGYSSIPRRWIEGLHGKDIVEPLIEGVMKHLA